jgi:hypothetical protein
MIKLWHQENQTAFQNCIGLLNYAQNETHMANYQLYKQLDFFFIWQLHDFRLRN